MTPYQVGKILFYPRDKFGNIEHESGQEVTMEEIFFRRQRDFGLPEWRIRQRWQEWVKEQEEQANGR